MRTKRGAKDLVALFYFFFSFLNMPDYFYIFNEKQMKKFRKDFKKRETVEASYFINPKTKKITMVIPVDFSFSTLLHEAIHVHINNRIPIFWNEYIAYFFSDMFTYDSVKNIIMFFFLWFMFSSFWIAFSIVFLAILLTNLMATFIILRKEGKI